MRVEYRFLFDVFLELEASRKSTPEKLRDLLNLTFRLLQH